MKYLHELTPKSRLYSVKVTMATKNRAIQPPGKSRYQRLTLKDEKGEVQYFIGVQLDGSQQVRPLQNGIPVEVAMQKGKLVKETAENVDVAVREFPDANKKPEDLWAKHSKVVQPKPHRGDSPSWKAIQKIIDRGEEIGLKHFRPVKPLVSSDTGSVHLVELSDTGEYFAMKAVDKNVMLNRNKAICIGAMNEKQIVTYPSPPKRVPNFQLLYNDIYRASAK